MPQYVVSEEDYRRCEAFYTDFKRRHAAAQQAAADAAADDAAKKAEEKKRWQREFEETSTRQILR